MQRGCATPIAPKSAEHIGNKGDRAGKGAKEGKGDRRGGAACLRWQATPGGPSCGGQASGSRVARRKSCVGYHGGYYHRGIERRSDFQRRAVEKRRKNKYRDSGGCEGQEMETAQSVMM